MTHTITWDHARCCDEDDPDGICQPDARVQCDAPDGWCRRFCINGCEVWSECDGDCDDQDPMFTHADPGVMHDDHGHTLRLGECNVTLFLEDDAFIDESYLGDGNPEYHDGLIEVEWQGEYYGWRYA